AEHELQVVQGGRLRARRPAGDRLRRDGAPGARAQAEAHQRRRLGLQPAHRLRAHRPVGDGGRRLSHRRQGAVRPSARRGPLPAAGVYPNHGPHADVVTSTTPKSLRGPRGGVILMNDEAIAKKINSAIFPGIQGGPLMHVIAAKAVAFKEALSAEFKAYQQQVAKNAVVLADTLTSRGLRIVSGRTESHVMLVDLRPKNLTGKEAEAILGA